VAGAARRRPDGVRTLGCVRRAVASQALR
jgi:hypothetical protein